LFGKSSTCRSKYRHFPQETRSHFFNLAIANPSHSFRSTPTPGVPHFHRDRTLDVEKGDRLKKIAELSLKLNCLFSKNYYHAAKALLLFNRISESIFELFVAIKIE
jgi:hypothetical protein